MFQNFGQGVSSYRMSSKVFLIIFRSPSQFSSESSGGIGLPKILLMGTDLPIFEPEEPKIGAEGAVLEIFGKFSKSGLICKKKSILERIWIQKLFLEYPHVNRPENGFLGGQIFSTPYFSQFFGHYALDISRFFGLRRCFGKKSPRGKVRLPISGWKLSKNNPSN